MLRNVIGISPWRISNPLSSQGSAYICLVLLFFSVFFFFFPSSKVLYSSSLICGLLFLLFCCFFALEYESCICTSHNFLLLNLWIKEGIVCHDSLSEELVGDKYL